MNSLAYFLGAYSVPATQIDKRTYGGRMKTPRRCWLAISTDDRQHAGNKGYDDVIESSYVWDSTVKYHNQISVGDVLVFFDKEVLMGAAIIDDVVRRDTVKTRLHCPKCGSSKIQRRKIKLPPWNCNSKKCDHAFDDPIEKELDVIEFRTVHERTFVDLAGLMTGQELRALTSSPLAPDSLRPMDFAKFLEEVGNRSPLGGIRLLNALSIDNQDGHVLSTMRVRIGQGPFRRELFAQFGWTCAITGPAPDRALEACHLYSYAKEGKHHHHGGLLIRRDLHTLFDFGLLTIDPVTLKVAIDDSLKPYPGYWALNGTHLKVEVSSLHKKWLEKHKLYWENAH